MRSIHILNDNLTPFGTSANINEILRADVIERESTKLLVNIKEPF